MFLLFARKRYRDGSPICTIRRRRYSDRPPICTIRLYKVHRPARYLYYSLVTGTATGPLFVLFARRRHIDRPPICTSRS